MEVLSRVGIGTKILIALPASAQPAVTPSAASETAGEDPVGKSGDET
jgi:hypothetical protein